jgi:peptidoglycan hydrolase-like protein with peptidoglycan-binding domain
MRLRTAIPVGLALLLAAGVSVRPASGAAKSTPHKSSASPAGSKTHRKSGRRSRRVPGQKAPTADRISEIQQALAKDGSFSKSPNGKWDDSTVEAMKKFQTAHGLNPSGKLDALTLQKLGLGSQTAGVAAPPPTASASPSLLSNPTQTARRQ